MFSGSPYFVVLIAVVGFLAGAIASVSGFGIGSLLTPVLAVKSRDEAGRRRRIHPAPDGNGPALVDHAEAR